MHRQRNPWISEAARVGVLCIAVVAGGCGGGGDDAATPPAQEGTTPSPDPSATTGSVCGISNFSAAVLARMNQLRAAGASCRTEGNFPPAGPLGWNPLLVQSSEAHSQDMAAHNFFSHTGSNGSTLATRVNLTGYQWTALGENIAAGYDSVDTVLEGLMASDGHCKNIMNATYTEVGMVCVPGASNDTYRTYWTMDLGRPR